MTMNLHPTIDQLNAWIDGELDDVTTLQVLDHLDDCATCENELAELMATKALLGSMAEVETPRSFALTADHAHQSASPKLRVVGGQATPTTISRFEPVLRLMSIAAVIAFLVLGGANLAGFGGQDADAPTATTEVAETNDAPQASQDQDTTQLRRGEVTNQGDAASSGEQALERVAAPQEVHELGSSESTGLEIATYATGALALVLIAAWAFVQFRTGTSR